MVILLSKRMKYEAIYELLLDFFYLCFLIKSTLMKPGASLKRNM